MTLSDWFTHCQKMFWTGVFASSMPTVGMVFTGTNADIRPGRNIFSLVTGWMIASLMRFASHSSASVAEDALPWACLSSSACAVASSSSPTRSMRGSVISLKRRSRPM
eukprot:scaffold130295_cov63-Phaeocystis_antarctica.AAC.2